MFDAPHYTAGATIVRFHRAKAAWMADRTRLSLAPEGDSRIDLPVWDAFQRAIDDLKAEVASAGGLIQTGPLRYRLKDGQLRLEYDIPEPFG